MYKILHVDLEAQNYPWYGQVASPFNPANYIVAPGWRVDTVNDDGTVDQGEVKYDYFYSADEANNSPWFNVLNDCAVMVCHNAQFDLKWFLSRHRKVLEDFLKRGGRVACTALGEYLVSHQQTLYPSLDETAVLYGGDHKVDGVKILWEQGHLTSQIDKDLLIRYLAGTKATTGQSGDIENTALCFYGQQAKLAAEGMSAMYWERCDALLAFAYCEFFGLYVDRDVANKNLAEQEAEIAELREQLQELLPKDLPEELEFNWGSDYHMSALVYGGPVKYKHKVPYDPVQYVKDDFVKFTDGKLVPARAVSTDDALDFTKVAALEVDYGPALRYASGKNKGAIKVFREDTSEEKLKWADTSVVLPGLVKVDGLPPGIREKYVGRRAEYVGARTLCDGVTPVYSTSTEALKGLKNFVPEVGLMVKLASLEKDVSTYYWRAKYATEEHARAARVPEAVGAGEQGEGRLVQQEETPTQEVRSGLGDLAGYATVGESPVPDMQGGSAGISGSTSRAASSTRPLPCNGEGAGSTMPHLQQGAGDDRGHTGGAGQIRAVPQVGVDGCTEVKGMMQYIGPDGIVHHSLNVTATVTTRLSSSNP